MPKLKKVSSNGITPQIVMWKAESSPYVYVTMQMYSTEMSHDHEINVATWSLGQKKHLSTAFDNFLLKLLRTG